MTAKQNKLITTLVSLYIIKKQKIKGGLLCRSPSQQIGIIQSLLDNTQVTLWLGHWTGYWNTGLATGTLIKKKKIKIGEIF